MVAYIIISLFVLVPMYFMTRQGNDLRFLFFILLVIAIVGGIILNQREKAKKRLARLNKLLDEDKDHEYSKKYVSSWAVIGLDEKKKVLAFKSEDETCLEYLPFSKITDYEIIKDGETITKKKHSTGSTVGRALLGGLLAGGVGAIVGGATSKSVSHTSDITKKLSLKIHTNTLAKPSYTITFFENALGIDTKIIEEVVDNLAEWVDILHIIVRQNTK